MKYRRLPIEIESPEERGYGSIRCNLTESSTTDRSLQSLNLELSDLLLAYGDHRGEPALRELIAAGAPNVPIDHVVTAPGAAAALFFVATALLERDNHAIVAHTNYATNFETPRLIGADLDLLRLNFDDQYQLDTDELQRLVRPGHTKLISITYPHNPTGAMIDRPILDRVIEIADSCGAHLLVDETYRDMTYGTPLPAVAGLYQRGISVSSLSKTFGIPGIRVGWAMTQDPVLAESLLAAKEQIVICGSVLDEAVATAVLQRSATLLPEIRARLAERKQQVSAWMAAQQHFEWVEPQGGAVCFPRLVEGVSPTVFRTHLNEVEGTYVGEGHWFEQDARSFRLGFGWPADDELAEGLAALSRSAAHAASFGE